MRTIIFTAMLLIATAKAQVGIGTKDIEPGIILKIESQPQEGSSKYGGLLVPRVDLEAINIFSPITGDSSKSLGLLVYNTANNGEKNLVVTPGFYLWNSNWERGNIRQAAMFSNQDTSRNLNYVNVGGNYINMMDIYANIKLNDFPKLYEKISSTELRVNSAGMYKITLNLDMAITGGADNFGIEFLLNDLSNVITERIAIMPRWNDEAGLESLFPIGASFIAYVPIEIAGSSLKVKSYELDPSTAVYFKNPDTSTLIIEKLW